MTKATRKATTTLTHSIHWARDINGPSGRRTKKRATTKARRRLDKAIVKDCS
jgi:hypothetical protein